MRYAYLITAALWLAGLGQAQGEGERLVRICDDGAEWPPYSYYVRKNKQKTSELTGYSVDVITRILGKHGLPFEIVLLPWKRCLAELQRGEKYLMALSASKNPEREQHYLFSLPYYKTHYYLFYSKTRFPSGLPIKRQADLNNYRLGGVKGYAYTALSEVNKEQMIRTVSYVELAGMLRAGRIDVFAEDYEVLVGISEVGDHDLLGDPDLGRVPLPGVAENHFHMLFTKQDPRGQVLQRLVNQELRAMQRSGELERLLRQYIAQ